MNTWSKIGEVLAAAAPYLAITALLVSAALLVTVLILIKKNNRLRERLEFLTKDEDGNSIEEILRHVIDDNQKVKIQLKNNVNEIVSINENLITAYRKFGLVKYNAFPGMAGKVSSCICLLNNENNGFILNSIHGQDGCYTYVKEIMNGKSINPLTKEDEEALKIALQMQV